MFKLRGAFQDVTSMVEAREALRQANERVALATDSGGIGIWDWDLETGVLTCDERMLLLHGRDPVEPPTADELWKDHVHPEDKARIEVALENALNGVAELDAEFRVCWDDGSVHYLHGSSRVTKDQQGHAVRLVGANWDVTESRRLLGQLAEQHERLRVTLHSIGDGVITTAVGGSVSWMNPVAERLTDWPTSEAAGVPAEQVFRMMPLEVPSLEEVQVPDRICTKEGILITRNGIRYDVESSTAPIYNKDGLFFGNIIVFRDVTEKRRLLAEAKNTTKLQLKAKDEFLSHVSHELRSPLTSIYSFSSIIADELAGETTEQQQEYLQIILKNVVQLQSMIEDLLTVTQSKEGKLSINAEKVLPMDAIVESLQTVQSTAAKKNIGLTVDNCPHQSHAFADPIRLRQVLIILLDNAIKFTPHGGAVSVHIAKKNSEFIEIQVKDSGCGIAVEKWTLVFENLYQINDMNYADTSQAGRTGLGLGLHIARNLVQRQGGNIWINSVLGSGSVFSFTIPVYCDRGTQVDRGKQQMRRKTDNAHHNASST